MGADRASARKKREEMERSWGDELAQRAGGMLTGTHKEVIEQIGAFVDIGTTDINLALRGPYDFEALRSFIEDVMPAFK
jgi:alkanesulfonate monooxygenase SsuD/methylene tetrahydromethanopterin reductase-like flavin-dependent oxidoreductase (luciferase family)